MITGAYINISYNHTPLFTSFIWISCSYTVHVFHRKCNQTIAFEMFQSTSCNRNLSIRQRRVFHRMQDKKLKSFNPRALCKTHQN